MKKIARAIWEEFIYGGHLTALGAPSIGFACSRIMQENVSLAFLASLYAGAESIYLKDRLQDIEHDKKSNLGRSIYYKKNKTWLSILLVGYIIVAVILPVIEYKFIYSLAFLILLSMGLSYKNHFKPLSRNITAFKNFFVSTMWALIPFLFLIYHKTTPTIAFVIFLLFILIRELINPTFCDIKDIEQDKTAGTKTLAVSFGKEKILRFLTVVNILSALPIIVGFFWGLLPTNSALLLLVIPFTAWYLKKSRNDWDNRYLYSAIPDLEIITYALLLI